MPAIDMLDGTYYSKLPNLSKTCHFDNLLTIVRSVIDHCDTIAIAD